MSMIPFRKIIYTPSNDMKKSDGSSYHCGYDYLFFGILICRIEGKRVDETTFK